MCIYINSRTAEQQLQHWQDLLHIYNYQHSHIDTGTAAHMPCNGSWQSYTCILDMKLSQWVVVNYKELHTLPRRLRAQWQQLPDLARHPAPQCMVLSASSHLGVSASMGMLRKMDASGASAHSGRLRVLGRARLRVTPSCIGVEGIRLYGNGRRRSPKGTGKPSMSGAQQLGEITGGKLSLGSVLQSTALSRFV